ncbi:hypothetical protein [Geobacter sp.]|uniref:hypothetical protein n=1 Tax=Geobacter sp. TaxID=46610 RepID=UPI0026127370|nr:hypothetical protein [Geobacter sp.]
MSVIKRAVTFGGFAYLLLSASVVFCQDLPSLAQLGTSMEQLITPETHEGVIMEVYANNRFSMREKTYLILKETEVGGVPAGKASFRLRKGQKVKAVVYRLKSKAYFVSDLTLE